jgi:hypothetical protein
MKLKRIGMAARLVAVGIILGVGVLAASLAAEAQRSGQPARVGVLDVGPAPSAEEQARITSTSPFWLAMKDLGWVYGERFRHRKNIVELAAKHRIVALYESPAFVEAGVVSRLWWK